MFQAAAGGVNANDYGLGYGEEADSEQKMVEVVAVTWRDFLLVADSGLGNPTQGQEDKEQTEQIQHM